MACCFEELGGYAVTPMLVTPCNPDKCCEGPPMCYPCLPRCPKGQIMYCCEKPQQQKCCRMPDCDDEDCCNDTPKKISCPPQPVNSKHQSPRQSQEYCCPTCQNPCKQVKTKYVIPCYRYEDGRIVRKLPVSAFKRNGMQDQEHSKLLGTANFLQRCPRDVSIECDEIPVQVKVNDPVKVPPYENKMCCGLLKKKPIEVSLDDLMDD